MPKIRILVINPVGHSRWDESDARIYRSYASPDTEIIVRSLPRGPETVETLEAYLEAEREVIKLGLELYKDFDAIIVNCFLDPGVRELRKRIGRQTIVVGPAEASLSIARFYGKPAVITVGAVKESVDLVRERIKSLGFDVEVRGIPVSVMDIEKDKDKTLKYLAEESLKARFAGADLIVLGCTGLAGMADELSKRIDMPVIDPAWASIKIAETLVLMKR
mgnify:CR=1 FL=1